MGPVLRHQHAAGTERALRRQHLLGRPAQLLLLARPGEARHWRALHPAAALLRRPRGRALWRFRTRALPEPRPRLTGPSLKPFDWRHDMYRNDEVTVPALREALIG